MKRKEKKENVVSTRAIGFVGGNTRNQVWLTRNRYDRSNGYDYGGRS